jgi:metal-responsive CopG/Arc/MetJ family transcriptional regulator
MVAPEHPFPSPKPLDRINLRLASVLFASIDAVRQRRPGNVSRNTWITEAIEEKLARELVANDAEPQRAGSSGG